MHAHWLAVAFLQKQAASGGASLLDGIQCLAWQSAHMKLNPVSEGFSVNPHHCLSSSELSLKVSPLGSKRLKCLLVASDVTALALALVISGFFSSQIAGVMAVPLAVGNLAEKTPPVDRLLVLATVCTAVIGWFWGVLHHYTLMRPYWDEVREIFVVMLSAFLVDATITFISNQPTSRATTMSFWGVAFSLLLIIRSLVKSYLLRLGQFSQPCILIGQGSEVRDALLAFDSEPLMGFVPVAILHPASSENNNIDDYLKIKEIGCERNIPVFSLTESAIAALKQTRSMVVFVMGGADAKVEEELGRIRQQLSLAREDVYLVPPVMGLPLHGMQSFNFFSHDVLLLRATSRLKSRSAQALKRLFDVVSSALALIVLSPLFLYVSWRISRESPGPVFFKQKRIGRNGVEFEIFKFRSMVMNADAVLENWKSSQPELWRQYVESNFKLANDPRITRIGRFIRRTSIDELPQLINVLLGQMSLVGPRPLLARELDAYGSSIDVYSNVRPGISGLWQISGRSSTTFETRIALDRWYIRNWSLWHDIVILFKTVIVVLRSEGAY